ncbi:MAG: hypothetical protein JW841_05120 [Deltaproteobacteria bacterium]|nr:hypothetical protein [Deltaproteobacteria bacterium]
MQDELGLIARDVLQDLERARPGFPLDAEGFAKDAKSRLRVRLNDLRAQYASMGADADFTRVARELEEILLRRYLAFAYPQSVRDSRGGGAWRGGDVISRIILSLTGLAIGGFLIWAPFIPLWEKWIPFVFMVAAPAIPDIQKKWFFRQHKRHLLQLEKDMNEAAQALRDSQPLEELNDPNLKNSAARSNLKKINT